jgi:ATP-binding cassette, subfamily B, bacterial PglK
MLETYRKLYGVLDKREKRVALFVLALMLFVALFETIGVASIMPFIAVLANPEIVETNAYLYSVYEALGFQSTDRFLLFLGSAFLVLIIGSLAFRAFAFWIQLRFAAGRNYSWSCRLASDYLHQSYEWFLDKHSGNLTASILDEVGRVVYSSLFPALQLLSHAFVASLLLLLLIFVDPFLAFSVFIGLGVAYAGLYLAVKHPLDRLGREILSANRMRFKVSQEMFGGIKDIKVSGLEGAFLKQFQAPSLQSIQRQVTAKMISELPSFFVQAFVFGGIMAILLYFLTTRGKMEAVLPVISLYALAGYRLMPALQAIYSSLSEMKVSTAVLERVHTQLTALDNMPHALSHLSSEAGKTTLPRLRTALHLNKVSYRYPGSSRWALHEITLRVPALETIGIVGASGSGKTTLVDVILGLLEPEEGKVCVDDVELTAPLKGDWRKRIGYVPQQIFLADTTVSGNIAFGTLASEIEPARVQQAARIANLDGFVTRELPNGYGTIVGERGVRLSGGQRQRIGIARAMYHNPDILILDEATSALDNLTEQAVMEAVQNLIREKTIIVIAHRLSTVRKCDQIFYLHEGKLLAYGTYDDLLVKCPEFRELAGEVKRN